MVVSLLAISAAFDGLRIALDSPTAGGANFLIVWLIPVAIGVAYARRLIGPRAALVDGRGRVRRAGGARADRAVRGLPGRDRRGADVQRLAANTAARAALHLDVVCLRRRRGRHSAVGRPAAGLARRLGRQRGSDDDLPVAHPRHRGGRIQLHALGLDAYDVHAPGFLALLALRALVFAVVMAAAFWLLSPLEHRRLPWWDASVGATGARSTAAGALICVAGVALVWLAKNGLADSEGWSALGFFLAAVVAARVCQGRSVGSSGDSEPDRQTRKCPSR